MMSPESAVRPPSVHRFLPFRKAFEGAIRAGRKTATSRTERYGQPGERLRTDFGLILLTEVAQMELGEIKRTLWREEGCSNPEHFEGIWRTLHRGTWDARRIVWLHRFHLVAG
jgi:hypothetical protein